MKRVFLFILFMLFSIMFISCQKKKTYKIYYTLNNFPEHTLRATAFCSSVKETLRAAEKHLIRKNGIRIGKIVKVIPSEI